MTVMSASLFERVKARRSNSLICELRPSAWSPVAETGSRKGIGGGRYASARHATKGRFCKTRNAFALANVRFNGQLHLCSGNNAAVEDFDLGLRGKCLAVGGYIPRLRLQDASGVAQSQH